VGPDSESKNNQSSKPARDKQMPVEQTGALSIN
jgi:hypothetical protein